MISVAPVLRGPLWKAGALVAIALAVWSVGGTTEMENAVRAPFFGTQAHEASGDLHVVEMDAASLAKINRWPWSRDHYAAVVHQLSEAGARSITFDVDFSSPSDAGGDAVLAAALKASKAVVTLPTFAQHAGSSDTRMLDTLPIASLREHAMVASVAVTPDSDGLVRTMPLGSVTDGVPRPSLAAQIAGRNGTVGHEFPIDFGIDPRSIPRHSFIDIEEGRFEASAVSGKDIVIGATAIEQGDRYATPRHGVLPGVIVQAMAAETLYWAIPSYAAPIAPLVAAFAFALWIMAASSRRAGLARGGAATALMAGLYWIGWSVFAQLFDIVPAFAVIVSATVVLLVQQFRAEQRHREMHDARTGLPNRFAFEQAADKQAAFSVAATIGGYERLETVLGEDMSSQLILRITERLQIGNAGNAVYRAEDRALAWTFNGDHGELESTLAGLSAVMRSPIEIGGRKIDVQMAFGIGQGHALSEAIHAASQSLLKGERWLYHAAAEEAALEQQVSLMGELDSAIGRNELDVLYQPKLALAENRITSVEALVRWNHPKRGYLRPDLFIPLAEESDRIIDLTLYVLQRTIDDNAAWRARGLDIRSAVNISARLVVSAPFLAAAEAMLTQSNVPAQSIIFEVTESAAIADPARAAAALGRFRDMGVAISMDDYGTGQSSLTYLKNLPLSELKIDRSFVQFAHCDSGDAMLVRSTVNLGHELGLSIVAEGVEDEECLAFLREVGCDYAQGYLIGKPMPAADLVALVDEGQRAAA